MRDILERLYLATKGLTRIRREDLENVFNDLEARGELSEKDREDFILRALDRLDEAGKSMSETIRKTLKPELDEISQLNTKLDELIAEIRNLKKQQKQP
jgi:polyhydroxyalkanoate synthesis regulator phasin